jgi:Uma2 family endonuclease
MATVRQPKEQLPTGLTVDEFLEWCEGRDGRYELYAGCVYAMPPERVEHAETKFAVQAELKRAIVAAGVSCHLLPDGMTVRVDHNTAYEPDALVYCGPKLPRGTIEVAEPAIVVEVLSPSTRKIDASAKLAGYFRLPSVHHHLIVDPDGSPTLHHQRRPDGTVLTTIVPGGPIRLDTPGLTIDVAAISAD